MPVRRWPLFAALYLTAKVDAWMPPLRWAMAVAGLFDVAVCLVLGYVWVAVVFAVLAVVAVGATFPAQATSPWARAELEAIRDADRAAVAIAALEVGSRVRIDAPDVSANHGRAGVLVESGEGWRSVLLDGDDKPWVFGWSGVVPEGTPLAGGAR
jgi:hypothetical protein